MNVKQIETDLEDSVSEVDAVFDELADGKDHVSLANVKEHLGVCGISKGSNTWIDSVMARSKSVSREDLRRVCGFDIEVSNKDSPFIAFTDQDHEGEQKKKKRNSFLALLELPITHPDGLGKQLKDSPKHGGGGSFWNTLRRQRTAVSEMNPKRSRKMTIFELNDLLTRRTSDESSISEVDRAVLWDEFQQTLDGIQFETSPAFRELLKTRVNPKPQRPVRQTFPELEKFQKRRPDLSSPLSSATRSRPASKLASKGAGLRKALPPKPHVLQPVGLKRSIGYDEQMAIWLQGAPRHKLLLDFASGVDLTRRVQTKEESVSDPVDDPTPSVTPSASD